MNKYKIEFLNSAHDSIELEEESSLSEALNVQNSPILFGCRTGICGTCLVQIEGETKLTPPADEDELEVIEVFSDGEVGLRLACQIKIKENLKMKYKGK